MQVLGGALDLEEEVAVAAEAVRQAQLLGAQPGAVGDAAVVNVGGERLVLSQQLVQALAPALFHSFEDELRTGTKTPIKRGPICRVFDSVRNTKAKGTYEFPESSDFYDAQTSFIFSLKHLKFHKLE